MNYNNVIKEKIKELEKNHNIRILLAIESGSRAWGFPSPDSDYDVRFIYIHPEDWYLSIHEGRDVVDLPVDELLDINGWDLIKALRLVYKHNAVLYEWIQSPIAYTANHHFVEKFQEILSAYYSPKATFHHYISSAKKYYADCIVSDCVKLKKLLYCLRVTLAAMWVSKFKTIPPMEFQKLLKIIKDQSLVRIIEDLIKVKAVKDESYQHPRDALLENFLENAIKECERDSLSLEGSHLHNDEGLNSFFVNILKLNK